MAQRHDVSTWPDARLQELAEEYNSPQFDAQRDAIASMASEVLRLRSVVGAMTTARDLAVDSIDRLMVDLAALSRSVWAYLSEDGKHTTVGGTGLRGLLIESVKRAGEVYCAASYDRFGRPKDAPAEGSTVCVLCGAPWAPAVKNRCECGGFCTWGPAKGAPPSSWTADGQPRPAPISVSTARKHEPDVWVLFKNDDVVFAEKAGERPAPDVSRDTRLVRYVPEHEHLVALSRAESSATELQRQVERGYELAVERMRELMLTAPTWAHSDFLTATSAKLFYDDIRQKLVKLALDKPVVAPVERWGVWWVETEITDYGPTMSIGGCWVVDRETKQPIATSDVREARRIASRMSTPSGSHYDARPLPEKE